jgi:hypothetical protein
MSYTATATETDHWIDFQGRTLPATLVTCTCASPNCGGATIYAPTATVKALPGKGRKGALHGLVSNRKVLGLPVA